MLGFVWLILLVVELVAGLNPLLEVLGTAIWVIFIADFALRLALAPHKREYLRQNWLVAISLVVPALRVFRAFRALRALRATRAARSVRLVRVVSSLNRGMNALRRTMSRRNFAYVFVLTAVVTFAGAAGMYAFELSGSSGGFSSYGEALWWTAMIMTTMGSAYWPETGEGRALCLLLAFYAFAVFGYVTATLASFFIGRDAEEADGEVAGSAELVALRADIAALRSDIRSLGEQASRAR